MRNSDIYESDIYESEEYRGFTIEIVQDENADDPRSWDNLGKMICFHRRMNLGDKHHYDSDSFSEGIVKALKEEGINPVVILPIYAYEHGGITISTKRSYPFNDQWDSGTLGFIYADRDAVLKEYSKKRLSKSVLELATQRLEDEVETYDQYLTGECYGFTVKDADDNVIDSCYGYYGSEGIEDAIAEGKSYADYEIARRRKEHFKQLATWIRNRVPLEKREPCPSFA